MFSFGEKPVDPYADEPPPLISDVAEVCSSGCNPTRPLSWALQVVGFAKQAGPDEHAKAAWQVSCLAAVTLARTQQQMPLSAAAGRSRRADRVGWLVASGGDGARWLRRCDGAVCGTDTEGAGSQARELQRDGAGRGLDRGASASFSMCRSFNGDQVLGPNYY